MGSGHEEESVIKAKILSLVTPAWLKYWMGSFDGEVSCAWVIANLSHTRAAMTVSRALVVEHFLVVDNPMSLAYFIIASSAVSTEAFASDFSIVESSLPGLLVELVEDITN